MRSGTHIQDTGTASLVFSLTQHFHPCPVGVFFHSSLLSADVPASFTNSGGIKPSSPANSPAVPSTVPFTHVSVCTQCKRWCKTSLAKRGQGSLRDSSYKREHFPSHFYTLTLVSLPLSVCPLRVNFMCQLHWPPGCSEIWSNSTLGVPMKVMLDEMNI